jgi:site-specific DNA-cytosine methylase
MTKGKYGFGGGETEVIKILELFGGIGSPRCALRNIGIPVKAIDYVEIDESAVRSYNAMFAEDLPYQTQSVVGWNLNQSTLNGIDARSAAYRKPPDQFLGA